MSVSLGKVTLPAPSRVRERQYFPFTVSVVTNESEMARAIAVRSSAYLRHRAPAAEKMSEPEEDDHRQESVVLMARSKLDGGVVGTLRINPNFSLPMRFESAVELPLAIAGARAVEFMRLGIETGASGRLVMSALAKASYEICLANEISFIFVCSRPPVDIIYRRYLFDDFLKGGKVAFSHAPGAMHSVLCMPVQEAADRWRLASSSMHRFFIETEHPDISVDHAEILRRFSLHRTAAMQS